MMTANLSYQQFNPKDKKTPMAQAFQKLGRYIIVSEIAKGGMATVYRAKLIGVEGFEKDVAIKKILPYWSDQKEFVNMLVDEAKILVRLQHNNIVQIFELAKEKNTYFIVMEFVKGYDLKRILNKLKKENKEFPIDLACFIVKEICKGLEFAHSRKGMDSHPLNIVHRDISPQNILVNLDGNVKITDFGIAKVIGRTTETAAGALKGKFSYMSPEQALGKDINYLTDIFALGALFYELVFMGKCFEGKNDLAIIEKVKDANIVFPDSAPAAIKAILTKAMAKDMNDRYQSALELRKDIKAFEKKYHFNAEHDDLRKFLGTLFTQEIIEMSEEEASFSEKTCIHKHAKQDTDTAVTKIKPVLDVKPEKKQKENNFIKKLENTGLTMIQADTIIDSKIIENISQLSTNTVYQPQQKTQKKEKPKKTTPQLKTKKKSNKETTHITRPKALAFNEPLDDFILPKQPFWIPWIKQTKNCFIIAHKLACKTKQKWLTFNAYQKYASLTALLVILVFISSWLWPYKTLPQKNTAKTTPTQESIVINVPRIETNKTDIPSNTRVTDSSFNKPTQTQAGLIAKISLKTKPDTARIEITQKGKTFSVTGSYSQEFAYKGKDIKIPVRITHENYEPQDLIFSLNQNRLIIDQTIELEPIGYGYLKISARPWGIITVDGSHYFKGGQTSFKLNAGSHVLNIKHRPNNKVINRTINIVPGKSIFCEASFSYKTSYMDCR